MQLDLFADSRDTLLRNDLVDALAARDASASQAAWAALQAESPGDAMLAAAAALIDALNAGNDTPFTDADAVAAARQQLLHTVGPAAAHALGPAASPAWLRPLWRSLAHRAAALPFQAGQAEHHAAALWLQAGDAGAAAQAVAQIESWRRTPAPLAWMAQARHATEGLDTVWPLLAELAWMAPARLAPLLAQMADPLLHQLLRRFEDDFDPGPAWPDPEIHAWFPAWLLTHRPALLALLRAAQPGRDDAPERGFRCLLHLLGLEREGRHHELVAQRQRLRGLHAGLYAAYMQTR